MYHYVIVGGYLLWRYHDVLVTGYNALYYCRQVYRAGHYILYERGKKSPCETDLDEDWVLCEYTKGAKPSSVLLCEI